jgi:sulfoxide reductase heme-binding subunit YedZ
MPVGILKALVFVLSLLPLTYYGWGAWHDTLGANPIEAVTRGMGTWTLNFLLITLAVTPLRKLTGWHAALRLRRMLGLFSFFYAVLHLTSYLWFDQFFDWGEIAQDILKRPFITVGMAAFMLLVPLAATSSNFAIRRLGGRRWQALHRTVYVIGILAVLHYSWLVKADQSQPLLYGGILAVLLGLRAWWREIERREQLAGKYQPKIRNRIIPIQPRR